MNRKNRFFDLNGFDSILQLPAFLIFALILSVPTLCLVLAVIMRETIEAKADWVLVGLFVLGLLAVGGIPVAIYLSASVISRAVAAWAGRPKDESKQQAPMVIVANSDAVKELPWQEQAPMGPYDQVPFEYTDRRQLPGD